MVLFALRIFGYCHVRAALAGLSMWTRKVICPLCCMCIQCAVVAFWQIRAERRFLSCARNRIARVANGFCFRCHSYGWALIWPNFVYGRGILTTSTARSITRADGRAGQGQLMHFHITRADGREARPAAPCAIAHCAAKPMRIRYDKTKLICPHWILSTCCNPSCIQAYLSPYNKRHSTRNCGESQDRHLL